MEVAIHIGVYFAEETFYPVNEPLEFRNFPKKTKENKLVKYGLLNS